MPFETATYRGFAIKISYDDCADSPRDWGNLGTFWTALRRYNSPDDMPYKGDLPASIAYEFDVESDDPDKILLAMNKDAIALPVYVYEHGSIAYRATEGGNPLHCQWDSGMAGFIFVRKSDVRKEWGVKRISPKLRTRVVSILKASVETYSQWANGSVYLYDIETPDGDYIDSCCGFYGYDHDASGLMETAKNAIDCHIRHARKQRCEHVKQLVRNRVPLTIRPAILAECAA